MRVLFAPVARLTQTTALSLYMTQPTMCTTKPNEVNTVLRPSHFGLTTLDLNNETSASGPWRLHEPDPSDFVPLHKRRELLLDNGIRILLLSRDMERDWTNETFLMRNTTARVAREMLGNDRSPYLRLSSPLYHDHGKVRRTNAERVTDYVNSDTPYDLPPDTPLPIGRS